MCTGGGPLSNKLYLSDWNPEKSGIIATEELWTGKRFWNLRYVGIPANQNGVLLQNTLVIQLRPYKGHIMD